MNRSRTIEKEARGVEIAQTGVRHGAASLIMNEDMRATTFSPGARASVSVRPMQSA